MRMMLMMMQHPVVETLDGSSSDEQHVVVGRMEMGPEIVPRLLEDNNGTSRVLYGQKVIVDEEEDEGEEEEEEEEEEEGGRGGGGEDHGGVHQLLSRNAHKLQFLQQHGYENHHHHPGQQIAATNGEEEEEDHHHHNGDDVYGVRSGQQHRQHEDEEDEEPKLGELGSVMLRLDSGNNLGESITSRERPPPAIDGDIGIVQQSPHHPDTSSGGGGGGKSGRGRTSREPAIEWSEGATTVLLQAFGDKYRALDRGNFTSKIWADIAARVNAHEITSTGLDGGSLVEGPPKTREQCRIKVDNLKKRYKVEREKQRVSGCTFSKWPFFDMMEELIGSNPRLMRGGVVGLGGRGGMDSPGLAVEIVGQPGTVRSSMQEGERMYYLEASAGGGEGDQTSQTLPKLSPILARGKRKRALKDFERRNVNAPSLMALFARYNIPGIIIEAMLQEDMDENTLINTKDIAVLIDQLQTKHQLQIKLGHAERIKQAIEDAREKKQTAG